MDYRAPKPRKPSRPKDPRLDALKLDPEDEGLRSGCRIDGRGYVTLCGRGTRYLHRVITGCPKGLVVDHLNGDKLDNRKTNLRVCTQAQNLQNCVRRSDAKLHRGVSPADMAKGYRARIWVSGEQVHLGTFATPEEANLARLCKEKELWGIQPRRLQAFIDAGLAEAA